jgi:addiction module HigA family antidote
MEMRPRVHATRSRAPRAAIGVHQIVLGKRAITADADLRLARYFGTSEGFFLGLQTDHDLMERRRQVGPDLEDRTARRLNEPVARKRSRSGDDALASMRNGAAIT